MFNGLLNCEVSLVNRDTSYFQRSLFTPTNIYNEYIVHIYVIQNANWDMEYKIILCKQMVIEDVEKALLALLM